MNITDYTRFSCPNQACTYFNRAGMGNITHRSWTGKRKDIERLRCTACDKEFSSNRGSLRENAKIPLEKQKLMLKCFRWGVPDTGVADIAEVDRKTVCLFQQKSSVHSRSHHDYRVYGVQQHDVQCDELHGKRQGGISWIGVAMVPSVLLVLSVVVGMRNQDMADSLLASMYVRCKSAYLLLTDGWSCYWNAFLRCFGELYQPRRKKRRGRLKSKALRLRFSPFFAQVVKRAKKIGKRWRLNAVVAKALNGKMDVCKWLVGACGIGQSINTSYIERFNASLRNCVGALRRKSRCAAKDAVSLSNRVWIFVSLYNWVLPHSSLSKGRRRITPAMAAGLTESPMSYEDYIVMTIHVKSSGVQREQDKLAEMRSKERVAAAKRYQREKIEEEVRWQKENAEEAA